MKPQYLNSLKAGIKTAVITFITTMVDVLTSLMSAFQDWSTTGNAPDLSILKGTAVAAALAMVVGIGNVVLRFIQAAAIPFLGAALDKVLGVIPDYLPPPASPVDNIGEPNPGLNRDVGQASSTAITVVAVLAAVALVIWIVKQ